jgi:hypothetical protein
MRYAGITRRSIAFLIDILLVFVVFVVIAQRFLFVPVRQLVIGSDDWFRSGWNTELYTLLTISLPTWLYFSLSETSSWQGPRKRLLRLAGWMGGLRVPLGLDFLRTLLKLAPWEIAHLTNNLPVPMWYDPDPGFRIGFIVVPLLAVIYLIVASVTQRKQGRDLRRTVVSRLVSGVCAGEKPSSPAGPMPPGGPMPKDLSTDSLDELRRSIAGTVIAPGGAAYDAARRCFNALVDRRPGVIVRCMSAGDVAAAFDFAQAHELEVAVRGGGHNPAGHCVSDGGLVIDLSLMRAVEVEGEARIARSAGGATWLDFDSATQAFGWSRRGCGGLHRCGGPEPGWRHRPSHCAIWSHL